MHYGKRIDTLCSLLKKTPTFADVGCDHGYCSQYVLAENLCERVIFSDVSQGSLEKAKKLLAPYVRAGRATAVLGNGFFGVPKDVAQVLIAGMGGYEIIQILSHPKYGFLPENFLFQPMHDSASLRRYVLANGGILERDFTFVDGRKYYDVLLGRKARDGEVQTYTEGQLLFGRENLLNRPAEFLSRTERELKNLDKYMVAPRLSEESRLRLLQRKRLLEKVLKDELE